MQAIEAKSTEELAALGNTSDKTRTSGAHDVTIEAVYETKGPTWTRIDIDARNAAGESVNHTEFLGTAKDDSAEELEKAAKATDRVMNALSRLCKAIGLKVIKAATVGATTGTDAKGNETTTFPKFKGKKAVFITYTEVQPDKTGQKAYANQIVDTSKFLDKDGKDGMGRDRREAFEVDAKNRIESQYGKENVPAVAQKLAQLKEQAITTAVLPAAPAAAPTEGMPTAAQPAATATAPVIADDDI